MDYEAAFKEGKTTTNENISLEKCFCGFASLTDVTTAVLYEFQRLSKGTVEEQKLVEALTFFRNVVDEVVDLSTKYNGKNFKDDLFDQGPSKMTAPDGKEKVSLGRANMELLARIFVNRIDDAVMRALPFMKKKNVNGELKRIKNLQKSEPETFEWENETSSKHNEFCSKLVKLWKKLDNQMIDKIAQAERRVQMKLREIARKEQQEQKKKSEVKKQDKKDDKPVEAKVIVSKDIHVDFNKGWTIPQTIPIGSNPPEKSWIAEARIENEKLDREKEVHERQQKHYKRRPRY